jgi:hypothetical protein
VSLTDAELARMEGLFGDGKVGLDVNSYIRLARELLAEVHRQRGLVEQTAASLRRQVGPLGAENKRLQADLAKAQESNRNFWTGSARLNGCGWRSRNCGATGSRFPAN